ncbi:MAG: hypothetical protein QOH97_2447 [Actinoplanes sp.]|nr:hypothetical protein [Actinoplanes sp.]
MNLVIDEGTSATGGVGLSCTGWSLTSNLFTNTLDIFDTTKTNFATGLSTWAPSGAASRSLPG